MLERVDACIASSSVVVATSINLAGGKVNEHTECCLSSKFYSLQHFLSRRREKERFYEAESTALAGQRETCHEEKERTETDLDFL